MTLNNTMTLKRRLVTAFLITLLLPTFLFTIVVAVAYTSSSGSQADIQSNWIQAFVLMAVMICITAIVLVFWLYRSIIRPLNILTEATYRIKEGDLDFSIPTDATSSDELELLCEDFEEMRRKLKEQIDARLQYEQDTVVLISNISHDLKTPLTALKGYAEGLLDGVADTPEKQTKYLKTIYTKANDMSVLVDELTFFSKIDTNVIPYNFNIISIDSFLRDCVEEMSLDTEIKGVSLSYSSGLRESGMVIADVEQLRRVLSNCISNSVKYMGKPQGDILINSSEEGDYIRVSITDNGPGIDQKDLTHIFDRFFRTDTSRNSKKGGTGLGLAIVKKIIEDHSGTISAASVPGEGTSIYFTLPRADIQKKETTVSEIRSDLEEMLPKTRKNGNQNRRSVRTREELAPIMSDRTSAPIQDAENEVPVPEPVPEERQTDRRTGTNNRRDADTRALYYAAYDRRSLNERRKNDRRKTQGTVSDRRVTSENSNTPKETEAKHGKNTNRRR